MPDSHAPDPHVPPARPGDDRSGEQPKAQPAAPAPHTAAPASATSAPSGVGFVARVEPDRRISWAWLLPLGALLLATWLGYQAWSMRGVRVTVQLENGHGLKAGAHVRYKGIVVGTVDSVVVSPDLQGVRVEARLTREAENLARSGSRFWVVRPQLGLTGVQGLETLIGPRFLAVVPGSAADAGRWQREFMGLSEPPIVESFAAGDLEIILSAQQRGSLHPGAPVSYRQTRVGSILSVGLAADGGAVEARAHIQQPYVQLIRPQTRFWDAGGLQAELGLSGVSVEIDSAEALLSGGVSLATPPPDEAGGEVVRTGHRFVVAQKPEDDWLEWQPMVAIGSSMLPPGVAPPSPMRARIGWTQGRWITREKTRQGWVLQTSEGLLGPADLLIPAEGADPGSAAVEVGGQIVPAGSPVRWQRNGLAMLDLTLAPNAWPMQDPTKTPAPDDCLIIADPAAPSIPLAAARIQTGDQSTSGLWGIDSAVPLDESWHGSCVVSRRSGQLIGIILIDDGDAKVAIVEGG